MKKKSLKEKNHERNYHTHQLLCPPTRHPHVREPAAGSCSGLQNLASGNSRFMTNFGPGKQIPLLYCMDTVKAL
jgi:hypothetical protein